MSYLLIDRWILALHNQLQAISYYIYLILSVSLNPRQRLLFSRHK